MNHEDYVYLAEGNANVVFLYTGSEDHVSDTVLRIAKKHKYHCFSANEHETYLRSVILPSFDQELRRCVVSSRLIPVTKDFLDKVDQRLQSTSGRPDKYVGSRLETSAIHGLLLPLLTSGADRKMLEFKPKWLSQSPEAPHDATWCRTCALRLARCTLPFPASALEDRFCPLDLSSHDHERLLRALSSLSTEKGWMLTIAELHKLATFLQNTSLIQRLSDAQSRSVDDVALAMTLRDCSLYLEMNMRSHGKQFRWQAHKLHIADLDRKSLEKASTWAAIENNLVLGGWYYGKDVPLGTRPCVELSMVDNVATLIENKVIKAQAK